MSDMTLTRTTRIDALSGLLNFNSDWALRNASSDPSLQQYNASTCLFTQTNHSQLSFDFTGFEVTVLGAYRYNYGQYQVYLDDVPQGPFRQNAAAPPPDDVEQLFQQEVFHWSGAEGFHTITVENLPILNDWNPAEWPGEIPLDGLDIDSIFWTSHVGGSLDLEIQNDDPRFTYSDDSWKKMECVPSFPIFSFGDAQVTTHDGSYFDLTFVGDRIDLYGVTGRGSASYTVQLDEEEPRLFSGVREWDNVGGQLLYSRSCLSATMNHTVKVTANLKDGLHAFAIDYAILDGILNPSGSSLQTAPSTSQTARASRGLHPGDIAAIVLGIVGGMMFLIAVVFWYLYRRQKNPIFVLPKSGPPPSPPTPRILRLASPVKSIKRKSKSSTLTPFMIQTPESPGRTDIIRSFPQPPPSAISPHPFSAASLASAGYLSSSQSYGRRQGAGTVRFDLFPAAIREGPAHVAWPARPSPATTGERSSVRATHGRSTGPSRPKLKVVI